MILIRSSVADDLASIQAIYAHWVLNGVSSFEIDAPDAAEMARRRNAVIEAGLPHIVAVTELGQVVGYAYAMLYRPRAAYRFTVEDSIYIAPEFAGQGLGRRLLEQVIAQCREAGYRQMIAVIGGGLENAGSVKLHEGCGFRLVGILQAVGYKCDRWVDTAILQLALCI